MKTTKIALSIIAFLPTLALAAPETFDFKDPKGVNAISFKLDAPLEAINGSANGITGTITFDPQNPGTTTGKIVVESATMTVPNALQTTHLRGAQWLDVAKYSEITFEAKQLKNVKTDGNKTTTDVTGSFSLHGVTNEMTIPIELSYLADKLGDRLGGNQKGDLLVLRANFTLKRSDFKIMPGQMEDKVSDKISLTVGIVGASPK
jgi:polyisoprenoid-binding protein YceI